MTFNFAGHEFDNQTPIIRGQDLKQMRLHAKITTSVAAEYMSIKSRKTIENWESGASSPGINQFMLLCRFFDMDASKIVAQCMARAIKYGVQETYPDIKVAACVMT